jgi:hypothetical protein
MEWTKEILNSTSLAILLNGVPRKTFQCKRGKARGLLCLLLFVLAAELLQHILNKAARMGLLHYPLNHTHTSDFPVVQYVR